MQQRLLVFIAVFAAIINNGVVAGEINLKNGSKGQIYINAENSLEFYNLISNSQKGEYQESFWGEVSGYFQSLSRDVEKMDFKTHEVDEFIFPMAHEPEVKLMVRNHDLLESHYESRDKLPNKIVDSMLIRDGIEIIYDYAYAMKEISMDMPQLLRTMGVQHYSEATHAKTLGELIDIHNLNKKYLGNKFINNHIRAGEWIELLGPVELSEALDLAFKDDFPEKYAKHPLLGGNPYHVRKFFQENYQLFQAIHKLLGHIDSAATITLNQQGSINAGQAIALFVCHHNLKLDQEISKEFKYFCDFVNYRAFTQNNVTHHPTYQSFKFLLSRHQLSL